MIKVIGLILLLFYMCACAHYKSGQYIELKKATSSRDLAIEYHIPEWALIDANPGKKFNQGEWVFIPLRRGILGRKAFEVPQSRAGSGALARDIASASKFLWPVPSTRRISSEFGHRWGREHHGIDIPAAKGSHVVATDDGVVIYSGSELGGYGNLTVISHGNGLFSVYAHTRKNFTEKGQKVHRGQVIATVGNTGRSTGPHLHFEIRFSGKALDPKGLFVFK